MYRRGFGIRNTIYIATLSMLFTLAFSWIFVTHSWALTYSWSRLADFKGIDSFNLFLSGNMEHFKSDVEGRVAVAGNVTLNNHSIGLKARESRYSLVVGGNLKAGTSQGVIGGGSINHGGIFAAGRVELNNYYIDGDIVSNSDVSLKELSVEGDVISSGDVAIENAWVSGSIATHATTSSAPVDFDSIDLASISEELLTYTYDWNGQFTDQNGRLEAEFDDPGTYLLELNATNLVGGWGLFIDAPADSTIVINVQNNLPTGNALDISYMDFGLSGGVKANDIIFNLDGFSEVVMHHIGLLGSILAPETSVTFYEGVMTGLLMAKNLYGGSYDDGTNGGQINLPVPEPEPWAMVIGALPFLYILSIRHRRGQQIISG